jgi:hypothetical protein
MSDDARTVTVRLNVQQLQLVEELCRREGLAGPGDALRLGLTGAPDAPAATEVTR